jgi:hypothetical protein
LPSIPITDILADNIGIVPALRVAFENPGYTIATKGIYAMSWNQIEAQ